MKSAKQFPTAITTLVDFHSQGNRLPPKETTPPPNSNDQGLGSYSSATELCLYSLQPSVKSQLLTVRKTQFPPLENGIIQRVVYRRLNETKHKRIPARGRCPINGTLTPLCLVHFCGWASLLLREAQSSPSAPLPSSGGFSFPKHQVPERKPPKISRHPLGPWHMALQSPHDLIPSDCYFYRLVLRSVSQKCYTHCHGGYSQACTTDGVF